MDLKSDKLDADLNNNTFKDKIKETDDTVDETPKQMPTFEEIRNAIPKQCFEKDLKLSLFYLALDYAILAGLYYLVPYVELHGGWWGLALW